MDETGYTCQQVARITGLSRPRPDHWRKTGLITPGVSVRRTRKNITSLPCFLFSFTAPLTGQAMTGWWQHFFAQEDTSHTEQPT